MARLLLAGCLGLGLGLVLAPRAHAQRVELVVPGPPAPPPLPELVVAPAPSAQVSVSGGADVSSGAGASSSAQVSGSAQVTAPPLELEPIDLPFRLWVEMLLGLTRMDPAVDGSTFGLGAGLELALLPWLAVGVHGGWSTTPDPGVDLDGDGRDDLEEGYFDLFTVTAGPRFRIPTSSSGQDGFVIELGGGYAHVDGPRPSGALLELAVSRWGDAGGAGGGPVVRVQQGLGDPGSLTTVLVGVQGGLDTAGRAPEGWSTFRYTLGWDLGLGGGFLEQGLISHGFAVQLGTELGIPIADVIEPRIRLDFGHRLAGEQRDALETYGASGALRLLLDDWVPLYLEAGAGWAFRFGTRASDVVGGSFLDVRAGARFIDCVASSVAVTLGLHGRIGLVDADALTAIYATLGLEYDSLPPTHRTRCIPAPAAPVSIAPAPEGTAPPPPAHAPPPVVSAPPPAHAPPPVVSAPPPPRARPPVVSPPPPPRARPPEVSPPPARGHAVVEAQPSGPSRIPLRFGLETLVGLADGDLSAEGPVSGAALTFGVAFDRHWGLDLRLASLGGPDELLQDPLLRDHNDALPTPGPMLLSAGGGPRLVVWSDEDSRLGWMFELVGSYAYLDGSRSNAPDPRAHVGRHGAVLELGLGPQIGERFGDGFGIDLRLVLRLQQGLGDLEAYRAVLLGLGLSFEADTPAPEGGAPDRPAAFQYTFGAQLALGMAFGADASRGITGLTAVGRLATHFGLPIGRWLELRALGGVGPRGVAEDRSLWTLDVAGGARLRFDEVFPLYLEAAGGYAFQYGPSVLQAPAGALLDVGIGARFTDCTGHSDGALEIGVGVRVGLERDRTLDALFVTLGYEYAGGTPMFAANERWHCTAMRGGGEVQVGTYPEPPGPRAMGPSHVVEPGASLQAPAPQPQTFEIVIGLAIPGAEVRLDPAALPLAALAGAGRVEVELIGPAQGLPHAEAELRAAFGARGVRIDAMTHVSAWDPTVRARITVYPPGW